MEPEEEEAWVTLREKGVTVQKLADSGQDCWEERARAHITWFL